MIATYRLQLHPAFGFDEVCALMPYFQKLGVSHLYLSPITEARPGSTHGYDVIDHNTVNPELGGREGFDRLLAAAEQAGLELILDFVPNHAGVGPRNARWQDMLAYGPDAPAAAFFDVNWTPAQPTLQGKILLPFLGKPYGEALDAGEIVLVCEEGRFYAAYYENRFALNPASCARVLETLAAGGAAPGEAEREALVELAAAYRALPTGDEAAAEDLHARTAALSERLDLSALLSHYEGALLHELLEAQHWRLAHWKTAGDEVNYRRFFSINDLVGLRMEDSVVFRDAHRLLADLAAQGGVAGVRIDHIDGLADPHGYLRRLKALIDTPIWVEKILAPGEALPPEWPVEGTTGYVFMNEAMGALLCSEGEAPLTDFYQARVPEARPYADVVQRSKRLVMDASLASERARLTDALARLSEADYHTRDFTRAALREALTDLVAAFDRYRTYLPQGAEGAQSVLRAAVEEARARRPDAAEGIYTFVTGALMGEAPEAVRDVQEGFTRRFQQYTAPVAAKGVEDTAFYRYLRLSALCEVGGEPGHFALPLEAFHERMERRASRHPRTLLATATHDHKRGEDTRMRLLALAEVPEAWREAVAALEEVAAAHRDARSPSPAMAYLFYQTLVALWQHVDEGMASDEDLADRLSDYMQKAAREAKLRTSWAAPDETYEEALDAFVRGVMSDARTAEAIGSLAETLARLGFFNGLSQLVLKCTAPGVPDFYQGCELPDLSLVDPDNRRPVNYEVRSRLLDELQASLNSADAETVRSLVDVRDPKAKLYVTARLLKLRGKRPALFEGRYEALSVEGAQPEHRIAFARVAGGAALVSVVPRFPATFDAAAAASVALPKALSGRRWQEVLSGAVIDAGAQLSVQDWPLPWGVLVSEAV